LKRESGSLFDYFFTIYAIMGVSVSMIEISG